MIELKIMDGFTDNTFSAHSGDEKCFLVVIALEVVLAMILF